MSDQIADPDFSKMSGVMLPDDLTEQEFRELLKACWDPGSNLAFGTSPDMPFEPWRIMGSNASPISRTIRGSRIR